jgi:uncharacterized Fe-S cluster protein YjdI
MSDSDVSENIESIEGEALALVFAPHLCIHSRHCVLEAPDVFRANTPGDCVFPDAMPAAKLSAVIRTAFVNYLEWGSRLAVINSADGVKAPEGDIPMPQWGWGAALGPEVTNGT